MTIPIGIALLYAVAAFILAVFAYLHAGSAVRDLDRSFTRSLDSAWRAWEQAVNRNEFISHKRFEDDRWDEFDERVHRVVAAVDEEFADRQERLDESQDILKRAIRASLVDFPDAPDDLDLDEATDKVYDAILASTTAAVAAIYDTGRAGS